jgi:hypothetical protein
MALWKVGQSFFLLFPAPLSSVWTDQEADCIDRVVFDFVRLHEATAESAEAGVE